MTVEAVIMAILSAISASIGLYLKVIKPKREEHAKQDVRKAVAEGDVAAVNAAIDSVSPETGNSSGQCNDSDIARRLAKITDK